MSDHVTADVLLDFLQSRLAPDAAREVSEHLAGCADCQALRRDIARLAGLLEPADRLEPSARADERVEAMIRGQGVTLPTQPRRFGSWGRAASIAAAVLLALAGLLVGTRYWHGSAGPVIATVTAVEAQVIVHSAGKEMVASPGMALHANDEVRVPSGGSAVLTLTDHGRAELGPHTVMSLGPRTTESSGAAGELYLREGYLAIDAAERKSSEPLRIRTPNAAAEVRGTRFHVGADEGETHMRVAEGLVGLTRLSDGATVDVPAGHRSVVASGVDPRATPSRMGSVLHIVSTAGRGTGWDRFEKIIAERLVGERLWRLAFRVDTCTFDDLRPDMLHDRALVIVSVFPFNVGAEENLRKLELAEADVPVICLEPAAYPVLRMTGPQERIDFGWDKTGWFDFPSPDHPLSAGLRGANVELVPGKVSKVGWGTPASSAITILRLHTEGHAAIFAYEAGSPLTAGLAPARRMGLFLDPAQVDEKSTAAWSLFEAAVEWSVEPPLR